MRTYNGDEYHTIAILGSFGKHYNEIVDAARMFNKNGFKVIAPKLDGIQETSKGGFLLLNGDEDKSPKQLETEFLQKCLEADCVYVCDVGGYIGATVSGELFYLTSQGQEIYFLETPQDSLFCCMTSGQEVIYDVEALVTMMKSHNDIYRCRDWPDKEKKRIRRPLLPFPKKG